MDDIEKLENWHYTEYNYSKKGGSFSSAKSNYRWIRQYLQNIRSKCSKHEDDINSFFSIASDLIDETYWDNDYPEPTSLKNKIKKSVKFYL